MLRPLFGLLLVPMLLSACGEATKDVTCGDYLGMSSGDQRAALATVFADDPPAGDAKTSTQRFLVVACKVGGDDSKDVTLKSIVTAGGGQLGQ